MQRESSRFSNIAADFNFKLSDAVLPSAAETDSKVTIPDPGTPLSEGDSMGGSGISCWLPYEVYVILQMAWWLPQVRASGPSWEVVFEGIVKQNDHSSSLVRLLEGIPRHGWQRTWCYGLG